MSAPTRSEILVLDALAQELRSLVPDLGQQAARAVVDRRDNTGSGVFTQFRLDRRQTGGADGATGLYGTIHGDWPGFSSPVAFQAVLSGGQLQGLQASTYDESTLGLNVAAAPVSNLFRIDASGRSTPVAPRQPARTDASQARRNTPQPAVVTSVPTQAPPMGRPIVIVPRTFGENGAVQNLAPTSSVPATPRPEPSAPFADQTADATALLTGAPLIALIAIVGGAAIVAYLLFGLFGLMIIGFVAARAWSHKPTRAAIQKALSSAKSRSD